MADHGSSIVIHVSEQISQQLDDFVARIIAIVIVVGLEVVQIKIGHAKISLRLQHLVDYLVDRHDAGQKCQGISVPGVLDLLFSDDLQQVQNRSHTIVLTFRHDDEGLLRNRHRDQLLAHTLQFRIDVHLDQFVFQ